MCNFLSEGKENVSKAYIGWKTFLFEIILFFRESKQSSLEKVNKLGRKFVEDNKNGN